MSKKIMLSVLEIMFDVVSFKTMSSPNKNKNEVNTSMNGKSIFFEDASIGTGENNEIKPITTSMLNMFEPTTFPTAMSMLPLIALVMLTESSGKLVPRATIVSPIKIDGTFKRVATALAPETKKSAPLIRSAIPIIKNKTFKKIVIFFFPLLDFPTTKL